MDDERDGQVNNDQVKQGSKEYQDKLDKLQDQAQVDPSEALPIASQQVLRKDTDEENLPPSPELPAIDIYLPDVAEDLDLIEKEWIKKVHEAMHQTQGDPFRRQQMITRIKKDYLKKRYNHVIGSDVDNAKMHSEQTN